MRCAFDSDRHYDFCASLEQIACLAPGLAVGEIKTTSLVNVTVCLQSCGQVLVRLEVQRAENGPEAQHRRITHHLKTKELRILVQHIAGHHCSALIVLKEENNNSQTIGLYLYGYWDQLARAPIHFEKWYG